MILSQFASMGNYVRNQGPKSGLKQPISEVSTMKWLTSCSLTNMQNAIADGIPVQFGVVGPGDVLWVPAGVLRAEKFLTEACLSVRVAHLFLSLMLFVSPSSLTPFPE